MKTTLLRKSALYTFFSLIFIVFSLGTQAQEIKERKLKFGTSLTKEHPLTVGAQKFADLVAQKSGGKIKVTVYSNAALGSDPQNLDATRGGTVDFCIMATGLLSGISKQVMIFDFPFLFNNAQEAFAIADGPVGTRVMGSLSEFGIIGLGIWDLGFRSMTNSKRPIVKAEDLQGLKIRVLASSIYIDLFTALGVNPIPMTFGEVYTALETKAIDGQENPANVIVASKFTEVQKYMSMTRHVYTGMPLLMSKKTWDSMSASEREIITSAAKEAKDEERKLTQASDAAAMAEIRKSMQVNELAPEEIARLRQKVQPVVDKYTHEVGESLVQQTNSELARLRGAK